MTIDAKTMLARVLEIEPFEVPDDASIDNCERWDSLGHMQLTMMLETYMGRPLESEEILSIMDLESLDRLLAASVAPSTRLVDVQSPIDLDAMKTDGRWFEAPSWPCSVADIRALQDSWWRALLDYVLESPSGAERDAVLLGVSAIISGTISLAETALALERAGAAGMRLVGGPPKFEYLRGDWKGSEIPLDTGPDTRAIFAARHPFIRSILSTRRFTPIWKIPLRLASNQGKVIAHNELLFSTARDCGIPMVFEDAGSMFNYIRQSYRGSPPEDQIIGLARTLTDRLIGPTSIGEPYRSRLDDLVHAKLLRILRITLGDILATRQAKLPNLIWGNTGNQYAARAMALEILQRGGETRFFTHAGTASMVHKPLSLTLGELAVSSTFVVPTQVVAKQEEMLELCKTVAPLRRTKIIGANGNKDILDLPLKRTGRRGRRAKVAYVSAMSSGAIANGEKGLPDVIYLDWQFRLAKYLSTLPIDTVFKPYPGGYFHGQRHPVENVAKTDYRRFEEMMGEVDVFIFDFCETTTIWEALCTDRKVIYLDLGLQNFYRAVAPMMARRCHIVPAIYDEWNRPSFDPDELEMAIFDQRPIDPREMQEMQIGA